MRPVQMSAVRNRGEERAALAVVALDRLVLIRGTEFAAGNIKILVVGTEDQALWLVQPTGVLGNEGIDKVARGRVIASQGLVVIIADQQVAATGAVSFFQSFYAQPARMGTTSALGLQPT